MNDELNEQLIDAVSNNNFREVVRLLDDGASPNAATNFGKTVLMIAADIGNAEIVKVLVDAKAKLNTVYNGGITALVIAVLGDWVNIVKILLTAKADPNIKNIAGERVLFLAKRRGNPNPEIIRLLEDAGAKE